MSANVVSKKNNSEDVHTRVPVSTTRKTKATMISVVQATSVPRSLKTMPRASTVAKLSNLLHL